MNLLESIAPFDGYVTAMAQDVLGLLGLDVRVQNRERLPQSGPTLIVCNHRSFLDPFILTSFLNTPINFVCHRYIGNVPVLREVLQSCGGFPLTNDDWYPELLQHSTALLDRGKTIGIFPEGAAPMLATHEHRRAAATFDLQAARASRRTQPRRRRHNGERRSCSVARMDSVRRDRARGRRASPAALRPPTQSQSLHRTSGRWHRRLGAR